MKTIFDYTLKLMLTVGIWVLALSELLQPHSAYAEKDISEQVMYIVETQCELSNGYFEVSIYAAGSAEDGAAEVEGYTDGEIETAITCHKDK